MSNQMKKQIKKLISTHQRMEPIITDTGKVILSQGDIDSRISNYKNILANV